MNTIRMNIEHDENTDEYVVYYSINGEHNEPRTYYGDDIHDARAVMDIEIDRLVRVQEYKITERMPSSVTLQQNTDDNMKVEDHKKKLAWEIVDTIEELVSLRVQYDENPECMPTARNLDEKSVELRNLIRQLAS